MPRPDLRALFRDDRPDLVSEEVFADRCEEWEAVLLAVRLALAELGRPMRAFDLAFQRYWQHAHPTEPLEDYLRRHSFLGRWFSHSALRGQSPRPGANSANSRPGRRPGLRSRCGGRHCRCVPHWPLLPTALWGIVKVWSATRRALWISAGTTSCALAATACTSPGGSSSDDAVAPAYDPDPAAVLTEEAPADGWPAAVLHEESVFLLDETGLTMTDLASGDVRARVEPEYPPLFDPAEGGEPHWLDPPLLTEVDGSPVVVAGFPVDNPRETAGDAQYLIEVVAVDADTGEVLQRYQNDRALFGGRVPQSSVQLPVYSLQDGVAVVEVRVDHSSIGTAGVDLAAGEVVWAEHELATIAVQDGTVIGVVRGADGDEFFLTGFDAGDGEQRWQLSEPLQGEFGFAPAGPWIKLAEDSTRLVDIETQETTHTEEDGLTEGMFCLPDEQGPVLACVEDGSTALILDTESGDVLWQSEEGAWDGEFINLWRGTLYVDGPDGPAALDARTGETLDTDPGIRPAVINDHAAVQQIGSTITAHLVAE